MAFPTLDLRASTARTLTRPGGLEIWQAPAKSFRARVLTPYLGG